MTQACLTDDALADLVEGHLTPGEAAAAHQHIRGCADCALLLAGLGDAAGSIGGEPGGPVLLAPGERLGRFELVRLLGVGGMGAVWAARDPELGRSVAVKLLRPGPGSDGDTSQSRSRLLQEAKAMATLAHPNVVPVFEVGEVGDQLFVVMELVEGETLGRWLQRPHSMAEILDVFIAAGRGLAAAHAARITHRDFKPDNVLLGTDGRPRVTDFGLAHTPRSLAPELAPAASLAGRIGPGAATPMGSLLGTPGYMALEQLEGKPATATSDLFAFCAALYEAAAGTRPFLGDDLETLRERTRAGALEAPRRKLPRWLRRELARGLRPESAERHASLNELLDALERGRKRARLQRALGAAALAIALVAALVVLLDRSGLVVRLRRLTPEERRVTGLLARADAALREHGSAAGALALKEAERSAPGNPRILSALASVQVDIGASAQANEAVARAMLRKAELPADERTELEILRFRTQREDEAAIARARAFWQEAPGDLARGLRFARELGLSHKYTEELALLDQLHRLPPPLGSDPTIDLYEAVAAHWSGDLPRALAAARRAYATNQARGDAVGMARARQREGLTLQRQGSDAARAREVLEDAVKLTRAAGDTTNLAIAELSLATTMMGAGELSGARALFEEAIASFKESGKVESQATALINLSNLLRRQRDLPAAIARATEAQTLYLELGDRRRSATVLTMLGDLRLDLGDLPGSAQALEQARAIEREVKDPLGTLDALTGLACTRLEEGSLAEARKLLEEARASSGTPSKRSLAGLLWLEAAIDFGDADYRAAEAAATQAARASGEAGFIDEQAEAEALLSRALLEQGRLGESRAAERRAAALLEKTKSGVARGEVAVADGRLLAKESPQQLSRAADALGAALAWAMKDGVAVDQWEARLALAELDAAQSRDTAALEQLARQARAEGFGLYARYAEAMLARPIPATR